MLAEYLRHGVILLGKFTEKLLTLPLWNAP